MTSLALFVYSVFLIIVSTHAFEKDDYDTHRLFKGEGTYYGGNVFTGNCAMRSPLPAGVYEGRLGVAVSDAVYQQHSCGACIRLKGSGEGLGATPIKGPIDAYVADRCFECAYGDLDLSSIGDGRWNIEWEVVPCNASKRIQFQFEGSHEWYWKLQPRGMATPAVRVTVDGRDCELSQDNHWIIAGLNGSKEKKKVLVYTVDGSIVTSYIRAIAKGVVLGGLI